MKLMFLGAPGAGKGTQAEIVSEKYNLPAISTGVLLRKAMKDETPLGKKAKEYVDNGNLVPDSLVIDIIKERLAHDDCAGGFILDGFPRTVPQAEALDSMGIEMDLVISIEVPDEKIVNRMSGRRVCSCGASYHTVYNPPENDGVCDKCSGTLTTRKDDKPEVVKERLDVYHTQTEPLISFYKGKGKLVTVMGQEKVEDTTALTLAAIKKFAD